MIRKTIASTLIILILINIISCASYKEIQKNNTQEIKATDEIKITTFDGNVYYITDIEVQESVIRGKGRIVKNHTVYLGNIVEVCFEDIKKLEVKEIDLATPIYIVLGVSGTILIVGIVALSIERQQH